MDCNYSSVFMLNHFFAKWYYGKQPILYTLTSMCLKIYIQHGLFNIHDNVWTTVNVGQGQDFMTK